MFARFSSSTGSGFGTTAAPGNTAAGNAGSAQTPTAFGQQPGTAFSAFGAPPSSSAFGAPAIGSSGAMSPFGAGPSAATAFSAPPGSDAPYSMTPDNENNVTIKLVAISAMPAYRNRSVEELRVEDYARGRKGPASFPGAGNANSAASNAFATPFSSASAPRPSPFGVSSSAATASNTAAAAASPFGGPFGSSNFGMPAGSSAAAQPNSAFGGFGAGSSSFGTRNPFAAGPVAAAPTNAFGQPTGQGMFGASKPAAASAFGASAFGASAPGSGGMFGAASGGFGAGAAGTGFGATQSPQASLAFGAAPPANPSNAFGFGASTPSGTSLFGAPQSQSQSQSQLQSQQQQPGANGTGMFGASAQQPSPFGASTGLFGSRPGTAAPASASAPAFGAFGTGQFGSGAPAQPFQAANAASPSALFQPPGATGTSFFGQQPQQSAPNSLFSGAAAGTGNLQTLPGQFPAATTTGLSAYLPSSSTPLGGSSSTPSGAFSFSSAPTQPASSLSTFGNSAPATGMSSFAPQTGGSAFSFKPTAGSSSFGTSATNGLFGSQPNSAIGTNTSTATPQSFNSAAPLASAMSSSLFPSVTGMPLALSSSAATNASPSLSLKPPLPLGSAMARPIDSTGPGMGLSGIAAASAPNSFKFTPRSSFRLKKTHDFSGPVPSFNLTGPAATSAQSGSSSTVLVPRKTPSTSGSLKKLIVTDFNVSSLEQSQLLQNQNQNQQHSSRHVSSASPIATPAKSAVGAQSSFLLANLQVGDTYSLPPLNVLDELSPEARRRVSNLVIGQKGFGQIRFLAPVDLSDIDLHRLFTNVVHFDEGEAVLYADPEYLPKPPPGQGLNVPAEIRIERVWISTRNTPASSLSGSSANSNVIELAPEKVAAFTEKLKAMPGTRFVSYDAENGIWTFAVDEF